VRILITVIFFSGILLIIRLYFIQVTSHDKWVAIAENQHNAFQELIADRGEIYMRDGDGRYPLAVNREYNLVYVVPKDVIEKDHTALELSRILDIDAGKIQEKLAMPDDPFEIIKKRLSDEEAKQIKESELKGVALLPEKYRYYPAGDWSQVIGFAAWARTEVRAGMA
jgi:cell division protein FtsI/penicillin-binding protein 2